jgi:two-component system aerobic respiration control protein ArcA
VLIAEDNYDLRSLFATIFKYEGYDVNLAVDGYEAHHYLEIALPNVIILDVNMPGRSGLEIARFVREIEGDTHVNIIAVTADRRVQCANEIKLVDLLLPKPVYPSELTRLAKRLLTASPETQ